MAPKPDDNRTLPGKEAALFRQLVKHYEVRGQGGQGGDGRRMPIKSPRFLAGSCAHCNWARQRGG